jgi:hypothetical protein
VAVRTVLNEVLVEASCFDIVNKSFFFQENTFQDIWDIP